MMPASLFVWNWQVRFTAFYSEIHRYIQRCTVVENKLIEQPSYLVTAPLLLDCCLFALDKRCGNPAINAKYEILCSFVTKVLFQHILSLICDISELICIVM